MSDDQHRAYIRVECDQLPAETEVVELDGREAIHQLFDFQILVAMPNRSGVDPSEVIGSKIAIVFESHPSSGREAVELRRMHGLVAACQDMLHSDDSRSYSLRVVPRMWTSTLVETLDIFQEISVPDIIKKKLTALHLVEGTDFEFRTSGSYGEREFTVQYKETDHAFISRLCEHLGISYFFEHRDGVDVAVFSDASSGFRPIDGDTIGFFAGGEQSGVHDLKREAQIVPSNFIQRDYNYRNPATDLLAQDSFDGFGGGIIEYGGHFRDADEGKALAMIRRQERECHQLTYQGRAADPRLSAGLRLTVTDHPYGDVELLPFVVRHRCKQTAINDGVGQVEAYHNTFEAIPAGMTFRPERLTPKPRIKGVVTGIIDSAGEGDYADIDDWGRYRVRFMFDTSGPMEGKASRACRMMQPHAGGGYGMHFPLRRGVEVLITFIDGDPDRPIIAGTVPNPQTPSPVEAGNARRNVLRTGAGNEMNIDDTKGSERIKFTVPHATTVFQLGAPNLAESGAALQTTGAWTASATSGSTLMTSFQASLQALDAWRSSGNIVATAEQPDLTKVMLAGGDLVKAGLAIAQAAIATAKANYDRWEKDELKDAVGKQDKATTIWENCLACREGDPGPPEKKGLRQLANDLPPSLQVKAIEGLEEQKKVDLAYRETLDTRRKRDAAREACIGLWTDQNEVAMRGRKEKFGQQYEDEKTELKKQQDTADSNASDLQSELAQTASDLEAFDTHLFTDEHKADIEKEKADIEAYLAKMQECQEACKGLAEAQDAADAELEKYHDLRDANSETHEWLSIKEKEVGAAAAAVGAVTTLVSTLMAIAAFAKKSTALAKCGATWAKADKSINKGDARGNIREHTWHRAKAPIHSLGSSYSGELHAHNDLLLHSFHLRIYARGAHGELSVTADNRVHITAGDELMIASADKLFQTAKLVDIYAQNKGAGPGTLKLQAWDDVLVQAKEKHIRVFAEAANQHISLEAGSGASDPKLKLESNGTGTISMKTHNTSVELKDGAGELTSDRWQIKGKNTEAKISESKITLKGKGRINLESNSKIDIKAKAIVVDGKKIDLG